MEKIRINALINAPRLVVWDAYTNPKHIVNWNFADPSWHCPRAENDMKVGGKYTARMEAKDGSFGFDFIAVYTAIDMGNSFTYEFGGRVAKVDFSGGKDQTEVSIAFDPETENPIELQRAGWSSILNNFKKYTEGL